MITKSLSIKKFLAKLGLLLPVLGCCIFLFNNEIIAKPALYHSAARPSLPVISETVLQSEQGPKLKIKIEGKKLWLNGNRTSLKNFASEVDKLTQNWSDDELMNASIQMRSQNSDQDFMESLNSEFAKTRLAKISKRDLLPPPPPMPPSAEMVSPPAPPAPVEHVPHENLELRKIHREKAEEMRAMAAEKRSLVKEEREKLRELQRELRENEELNAVDRKRMVAKVRRKEMEIQRKRVQLEREQVRVERAKLRLQRVHPAPPAAPAAPPPPNPEKVIDEIARAGGSFFYNDEKIDAVTAKKIAKDRKHINVHITKREGEAGKVEIFDDGEK